MNDPSAGPRVLRARVLQARVLRSLVLLVASLALLGAGGVDTGSRTAGVGAGQTAAVTTLPVVLDDSRGTLSVLRAALAAAAAQPVGTDGLPPGSGPVVGPPPAPAPGLPATTSRVASALIAAAGSRAPPYPTGT